MVATEHNLKIELLENVCFFSETFEVMWKVALNSITLKILVNCFK
jgi:hypothetical protein